MWIKVDAWDKNAEGLNQHSRKMQHCQAPPFFLPGDLSCVARGEWSEAGFSTVITRC
jgi:hypothetical protein